MQDSVAQQANAGSVAFSHSQDRVWANGRQTQCGSWPITSDLDFVFAFNSSIRKAFELIRELTTAPPPNRNFPSADNSCATTGAILFPVFVGVVLVAVVANGFTEQIKGTGKWK